MKWKGLFVLCLAMTGLWVTGCSDDAVVSPTASSQGVSSVSGGTSSSVAATVAGTWVTYQDDNKEGGLDSQYTYRADGSWDKKYYNGAVFVFEPGSGRGHWGMIDGNTMYRTYEDTYVGPSWQPEVEQMSNVFSIWYDSERLVSDGYTRKSGLSGIDGEWVKTYYRYNLGSGILNGYEIATITLGGMNGTYSNYEWTKSGSVYVSTNKCWITPVSGSLYKYYRINTYDGSTNVCDLIWDGSQVMAVDANDDGTLWRN